MLFKRRTPLSFVDKLWQIMRPQKGYIRTIDYLKKRFYRMSESNYSMAMGFTCGAMLSFTPFVGFHFIIAGFIAYSIKASIFMAAIGTLVGNPWTFPIMWWASIKLGKWTLDHAGLDMLNQTSEIKTIVSDIYLIIIPWIVGSFLLSAILGPPTFFLIYWLVRELRQKFYKKLQRKGDEKQFF